MLDLASAKWTTFFQQGHEALRRPAFRSNVRSLQAIQAIGLLA